MDDQDLKYPQWQAALFDALAEIRHREFVEKVEKAEAAIVERVRVLSLTNGHQHERRAVRDALLTLRLLQRYPRDSSPESLHLPKSKTASTAAGPEAEINFRT